MSIGKEVLIACALVIAAACGGAASATSIVFDLSNGPGYQWDSSFFVTSGGYTLTFSNPGGAAHQNTIPSIPASNNPLLPNNQFAFERDPDGLIIGNYWSYVPPGQSGIPYPGYTSSFTMTLSGPTDLVLSSYNVEFVSSIAGYGPAEPFTLSRNGTTLSASNSLASTGTFNLAGGPLLWESGQSLDFTAAGTDEYDLSQIRYLTATVQAVPEPVTLALAACGLATAGIGLRRRKLTVRRGA